MFAVLHLQQFALQAALRHEPELWTRPIALVDPAMSTPRVCDCTEPARAAGVETGLTPTQTLARCREIIIRHRSPAQETAATDATLQCAAGFSPNLEHTAPGTVTLDLRGLAELSARPIRTPREDEDRALPEALQDWAGRLRTALAALNLRARIGTGITPNIARHAARWCDGIEIVTDPAAFIAQLPVAALEPSTDVTLILHKWGVRTVGELLALGQDALVDRLGLEALALFAAASTTALRPLNLVRPSEHFEEAFDFEHPIETIEPLLFILRRFIDALAQRLEPGGFAAELLALGLRLESGEVLERRLRVPQPTRAADVLFRMLHTHLETLRTASPIVGVSLKADPTQPEQRQFSLFEAALRDPHQFQETLARLSALVGSDRVGTPVRENSHRPDAFKLVPPDFESAPEVTAQRVSEILRTPPLRRFRPAKKAEVEQERNGAPRQKAPGGWRAPRPRGVQGVPDERAGVPECGTPVPLSIRCAIARGKLAVALGPWRASGNWWEPGGWQREEWDVQTRDGETLRLVQQPDGWVVEGILD